MKSRVLLFLEKENVKIKFVFKTTSLYHYIQCITPLRGFTVATRVGTGNVRLQLFPGQRTRGRSRKPDTPSQGISESYFQYYRKSQRLEVLFISSKEYLGLIILIYTSYCSRSTCTVVSDLSLCDYSHLPVLLLCMLQLKQGCHVALSLCGTNGWTSCYSLSCRKFRTDRH